MDIVLKREFQVKQYTIQLFQNIIEEKNKKAVELATLTAEERYLKLLKETPQLLQNVPIQYICITFRNETRKFKQNQKTVKQITSKSSKF